jgi:hypothetical protein
MLGIYLPRMPLQVLSIQDAHNITSRERFHELAGSRSSSGTRHKALVYSKTVNTMREAVKPAAVRMVVSRTKLSGSKPASSTSARLPQLSHPRLRSGRPSLTYVSFDIMAFSLYCAYVALAWLRCSSCIELHRHSCCAQSHWQHNSKLPVLNACTPSQHVTA